MPLVQLTFLTHCWGQQQWNQKEGRMTQVSETLPKTEKSTELP
jgi:hypothetical protein